MLIAGLILLVLSLVFLLISIVAAIQTRRTGRFSSGVHIVPTLFAIFAAGFGACSWPVVVIISLLDLGTLFFGKRPRRS